MEREELVRQIAKLEATMEQVPSSVRGMLRSTLEKLQWRLEEIESGAQITASAVVDYAVDGTKPTDAEITAMLEEKERRVEELLEKAKEDAKNETTQIVNETKFELFTLQKIFIEGYRPLVDAAKDAVIDAATRWLADMIGGAIEGAAGEILNKSIMGDVGKGTELGEIMAAQAPEAVKKGSPAIRVKLEEAERAVAMELDTNAKKLIDKMTKGHSPITPDESTIAAGTIGAGSLAGFVGLSAAGAAIEAATLGQMEIPGHTLIQLGAMYGLAKMAGSIVSVPYKWAVDIGHNYKWASVFQPLIPGMTDLVRFEVREVWRDEFRKEQLEETPSEDFKHYAAYQGFSGEHADSYWAAHWELPTVGQAYEMFHRLRAGRDPTGLTFTRDDLYKLMRRQDILKRYRDPLIAIAYDIPTRREIRMMVNAGTLSRDDAEQIYLDRGIDPRFAGTLADFAWARAQRDPYRERVITACIGLAKEGYDTEDDFRARLRKREVPEQVIDDSWELAQISYEFDYKRDLLAELRDRLRKGKITIETFAAELSRIVKVAERANTIVERERARIKLEAS